MVGWMFDSCCLKLQGCLMKRWGLWWASCKGRRPSHHQVVWESLRGGSSESSSDLCLQMCYLFIQLTVVSCNLWKLPKEDRAERCLARATSVSLLIYILKGWVGETAPFRWAGMDQPELSPQLLRSSLLWAVEAQGLCHFLMQHWYDDSLFLSVCAVDFNVSSHIQWDTNALLFIFFPQFWQINGILSQKKFC